MEANILKIERNVHGHGPGRRTVVYFKGCTLHCPSCYSPQFTERPTDMRWDEKSCLFCGICMHCCPTKSIHFENHKLKFDVNRCTFCGECVKACASHTLHFVRKIMNENEIMNVILEDRDARLAEQEGDTPEEIAGGVTFSGGEPLFQAAIVIELMKRCRELGINISVETCGYGSSLSFAKMVKYADRVIVSVKHYDNRKHIQMTGVSNGPILENLKYAVLSGKKTKAFIMVKKGENDTLCDARRYAELLNGCGVKSLALKTRDNIPLESYAEIIYGKGIDVDVVYGVQNREK